MRFFRKPSKSEKKENPQTIQESTLEGLCKKYFPQNPEAMYEDIGFLPLEVPVGYTENYEELKVKAQESEKNGKIREASELYRKAAGLSYKHGTPEELKSLLERRKELLKKIPEKKKVTILDKKTYDTIIKNSEISWKIGREYLGLPLEKESKASESSD